MFTTTIYSYKWCVCGCLYDSSVNVVCNFVLDGLWPVELAWGFLVSNNSCSWDSVSRSRYTTVSAGTNGPFHDCADLLIYKATSPPN